MSAAHEYDPLMTANESISKAFATMQAELINRVTSLISGIETRAIARNNEMKQQLDDLRSEVAALTDRLDTHNNPAQADE